MVKEPSEDIFDVEILDEYPKKETMYKNAWSLEESVLLMRYAIYFYKKNKKQIDRGELLAPCNSENVKKELCIVCDQADLLKLEINIYTIAKNKKEVDLSTTAYLNLETSVNSMFGITLFRIKDFFKKDKEVPKLTRRGYLSYRYQALLENYTK